MVIDQILSYGLFELLIWSFGLRQYLRGGYWGDHFGLRSALLGLLH